jgi:hypothetical protein
MRPSTFSGLSTRISSIKSTTSGTWASSRRGRDVATTLDGLRISCATWNDPTSSEGTRSAAPGSGPIWAMVAPSASSAKPSLRAWDSAPGCTSISTWRRCAPIPRSTSCSSPKADDGRRVPYLSFGRAFMKSMGNGKTMVEFFSAAISVSVASSAGGWPPAPLGGERLLESHDPGLYVRNMNALLAASATDVVPTVTVPCLSISETEDVYAPPDCVSPRSWPGCPSRATRCCSTASGTCRSSKRRVCARRRYVPWRQYEPLTPWRSALGTCCRGSQGLWLGQPRDMGGCRRQMSCRSRPANCRPAPLRWP